MNIDHKRGTVYLSGGMEYCPPEDALGAGWREMMSRELEALNYVPFNITELDIAYQGPHGDIMKDIRFDTTQSEIHRKAAVRHHFVDTDLKLIGNDTDVVVLLYDEYARRGAGTISEAQYAYLQDIPILIVSQWENWEEQVPSWLHALSTKVFTSFTDCLEYMSNLPEGILIKDQYGNRGKDNHYLCSLSGEVFEKQNHHFVSNVSPLYSKESVQVVKEIKEDMKNRYEFICEYLERKYAKSDALEEMRAMMCADEDMAFGWLSNLTCSALDAGADIDTARQAAEDFMFRAFGSKLTHEEYNNTQNLKSL